MVYGSPIRSERKAVWNRLTSLRTNKEDAWLLTGDFNELLGNHEKVGGPTRPFNSFVDFKTFIAENGLWCLRSYGNPLSWRGMRYNFFVRARLDRTLANTAWSELFPTGRTEYLRFEGSDHRPLVTCVDDMKIKRRGCFRFDNRLREKPEIAELIQSTWAKAENASVLSKTNLCRMEIINWTKANNLNAEKKIKETQVQLEQALTADYPNTEVIISLTAILEKAYVQEEEYWRQRSRTSWLKSGDQNSRFFHAVTRQRRVHNRLVMMENEEGNPCFEENSITQSIVNYFQGIFTSEGSAELDCVREALSPKITTEMNLALLAIPDLEEIKAAAFSLSPHKAPGPDGFPAGFYQTFWSTVGGDIISEVQQFFQTGSFPKRVNETHIRLIPKIDNPRKVSDYRPIALCNTFYKLITKILTRRMQPLLTDLIDERQSAFVPGRSISDNVLITHEILHFLRISTASKRSSMAIKTDMSKAYDRVEWGFLKCVLERLGFHKTWIGWIMECVSTVSYSFLINGSPQGHVVPTRGLRQGDPLSPYLFILSSEVLSGLCRNAHVSGDLAGIRVSRNGPRINHLLFADDTMFFCHTNKQNCACLLEIIKRYSKASGQTINLQKSSITFGSITEEATKLRIKRQLKIFKESGTGKYLGLPEYFGCRKRDIFASIVDRVRQKARSWTSRFLSPAGKLVMLKSILSALPSYAMSCFKIPITLCKKIQTIYTRFWWDKNPEQRKMNWVSWKKLSIPKNAGGLGFRDVERFNDALLAKIGWRLITNPHSLLATILKAKYYADKPFLEAQPSSRPSHGWRSILEGRKILRMGLGWLIGDGKQIRIWQDDWLSSIKPERPMGPVGFSEQNLTVSALMDVELRCWNWNVIREIIPDYEDKIRKLIPGSLRCQDKFVWLPVRSGIYSTRSGYGLSSLQDLPNTQTSFNWQSSIWRLKASPKIKMFIWKVMMNALPVGLQLVRRGITDNSRCNRCNQHESISHALFLCNFAQQVWNLAPISQVTGPWTLTIQDLIVRSKSFVLAPPIGIKVANLFAWVCWNIWTARNQAIFNNTNYSPMEVMTKAIRDAKDWELAQDFPIINQDKSSVPKLPPSITTGHLVFIDAAWQAHSRLAGLGWHYQLPDKLEAGDHSASLQNIPSALSAEAQALRVALIHALDSNRKRLLVLSDSQILVGLVNTKGSDNELYGILEEIKFLSSSFSYLEVVYISRTANVKADGLAKFALQALSLDGHDFV